ncbi:putative acyl-CoA dehydrogenase [Enhydrobacter aerosaccus]|uniref:Putative acyl-CoA dehydrogenase n=1 Tax=Enhydrobacter aerosaccus TaxID=225324 RepID=A0A1T4PAT0_9HYPH|nr:acyl-CoA dehydrogenase family protein [Enhydrobacter aerosaccus]SJZ88612.1 putative acyl-CoA dehydrogenase [Enhydrobacter aerosaccus]
MSQGFLEDASFNQSPAFGDVDLFTADKPLADAAARYGLDLKALSACGKDYGSAATLDLGRVANENPPKLRTMDGKGNRIDFVEFHPAYHALMAKSIGFGIHGSAHDGSEPAGPMTSRAVRLYLATQAEAGHLCPITMTHACIGALQSEPALLDKWRSQILSRTYDPRPLPWWEKKGVTLGMGMTERQGGTDVRANITEAVAVGDHVEISGHKWFMSAPMCDAFLVLAQAEGGLTCYLMPRYRPDGSRNGLRFQRLKDKLGNKSNASSEVEFHSAYAERVGPEGAGVRTIIEMVNLTRLDCAVASAGQMRFGLSQALNHIRNRSVFQRRLSDQPAMQAVAADLALELEAQVALVFRLAHAVDKGETAYARLLTPAVKFLVCKSTPQVVYESLECLGGNGYSEELPMARLYREAPLNAIWEGSGNVMALDVLRAAARQPDAAMETISALVRTASKACDVTALATTLERTLKAPDAERRARFLCEGLAKLAALAALAEANSPFASLYGEARLKGGHFSQFGTADLGRQEIALMDRALAA